MRARSSSLKCGAAGQLEVVVEAVLDRGADGVAGTGPQVGDRLGQHVGGGVAQDVAAGVGVVGDDGDAGAVRQGGGQVGGRAVDLDRHRGLGQTLGRWTRRGRRRSSRRAAARSEPSGRRTVIGV